jgi:hypothetical protein
MFASTFNQVQLFTSSGTQTISDPKQIVILIVNEPATLPDATSQITITGGDATAAKITQNQFRFTKPGRFQVTISNGFSAAAIQAVAIEPAAIDRVHVAAIDAGHLGIDGKKRYVLAGLARETDWNGSAEDLANRHLAQFGASPNPPVGVVTTGAKAP